MPDPIPKILKIIRDVDPHSDISLCADGKTGSAKPSRPSETRLLRPGITGLIPFPKVLVIISTVISRPIYPFAPIEKPVAPYGRRVEIGF